MSSEQAPLRLLVISDLRRIAADDPLLDWQRPILDSLTEHVRRLAPEARPHLIALLGDVTAQGEQAQLGAATRWLEALRHAAGLEPERLLVVAGERDVDPALAPKSQALIREAVSAGHAGIAALQTDDERWRMVGERLSRFGRLPERRRLPQDTGRSWWFSRQQIGAVQVGLAGLCSAWATTGAHGEPALIGQTQVDALHGALGGCALRIALVHHPIDALWDVDRAVDSGLQARVDLLLSGHTSERRQLEPRLEAQRAAYIEVSPGPLCTSMTGPSYAAMVEVHADRALVTPLRYDNQGWCTDGVLAPEGRITLRRRVRSPEQPAAPAPAPQAAAPPPLPADPYPVLARYEHPATFGGRQRDLDHLSALLQRERLIWALYAASGAGKSSLLHAGLIPALKAKGERVVCWEQPTVSDLGQRLLRALDPAAPAISDDDPVAFASALAEIRDQGARPVLILDQLEEVFASPVALSRLGAHIAASALAPGGRAARWVLVYREDFHGRILDWLADVKRYAVGVPPGVLDRLPSKLSGPETLEVWSIPLLGEAPGAEDRLGEATAAFKDAIERPLHIPHADGAPHYPYRIEASDAHRLALAFGRARVEHPADALAPELQVVLDRLIAGRRATRSAPVTLSVPQDPTEVDQLISDAIGAHLRRKLDQVGAATPNPSEAAAARTTAMLLLMRLADDEGRRRPVPVSELMLDGAQDALLRRLKDRGVWLVREEIRDGVPYLTLPHDRVAAEINTIQRDPLELQKYKLDVNLVELWRFVSQRAAAWRAGDRAAVDLTGKRFNALERLAVRFPWDELTRSWWRAAEAAREAAMARAVRWGALAALVVLVFLGGIGIKWDQKDLESAVRSQPPASGEPLRALYTLMSRYRYDGAALAAVLGASGEAGSTFNTGTRDEIFGLGPAGLNEAERLAEIPPLVEALASHVEGAPEDESFYGALLAAVEVVRFQDVVVADGAKGAVVRAMREARGQPPAIIPTDGQWTIPIAGTFAVGCFRDAADSCRSDETNHTVMLAPYRVRKNEETLGQYRRFSPDHLKKEGYPDDWPVFQVNWYEASAYAAWLGAALPTEAQWEVAARGGCAATNPSCHPADYRESAYYAGPSEDDLNRVAFTTSNRSAVNKSIGAQRPLKATENFSGGAPHPLGLVHIHGNIAEWTSDWYAPYPEAALQDPLGPPVPPAPAAAWRVLRGGSWGSSAMVARSAYRSWSQPSNRNLSVGFRLVLPQPSSDLDSRL